jgi:Predicted acyl-CoA transferases/carnitine dehydratase
VRVVDLGWMLASAGAGRYLAALGAEVIKVEHESRADGMRFGAAACPLGGRAERQAATGTIPTPPKEGSIAAAPSWRSTPASSRYRST